MKTSTQPRTWKPSVVSLPKSHYGQDGSALLHQTHPKVDIREHLYRKIESSDVREIITKDERQNVTNRQAVCEAQGRNKCEYCKNAIPYDRLLHSKALPFNESNMLTYESINLHPASHGFQSLKTHLYDVICIGSGWAGRRCCTCSYSGANGCDYRAGTRGRRLSILGMCSV